MLPAICLFGFLGAFLLLRFADKVNLANRYLAYHFMLNSLFGIAHWASAVSDSANLRALFLIHYFPFFLLNTPFLYFYVRSIFTDRKRIRTWDYLHFLPFFIILFNVIPYSFQNWGIKLDFAEKFHRDSLMIYQVYFPIISFTIYFIFRSVLSLAYVIAGGNILWKAMVAGKLKSAKELEKWLIICLSLAALFNLTLLIFVMISMNSNNGMLVFDVQGTGRSVATVIMAVLTGSIYFFPKILYGLQTQSGNSLTDVITLNIKISKASKAPEFSKSRLKLVAIAIQNCLPKKHYLEPGFCLSDLVKEVGMPEHLLTYYFNNYKGITFLKWKNQLRIEEAIDLLNAGKAETNTLESVGKACGYKSRSNFIDSFKSQTGESPSAFLKRIS